MKRLIAAVMVAGAVFMAPMAADVVLPALGVSMPMATVAEAKSAPDVAVHSLTTGEETSIAALHDGRPLFLNFWASWCPPCVGEMPHIQSMYERYGDQMNFAAVTIDDVESDATDYLADAGLTLPTYAGDVNDIAMAYGIEAIPLSLIVSPDGEIIAEHLGGMSAGEMERFIKSAL